MNTGGNESNMDVVKPPVQRLWRDVSGISDFEVDISREALWLWKKSGRYIESIQACVGVKLGELDEIAACSSTNVGNDGVGRQVC